MPDDVFAPPDPAADIADSTPDPALGDKPSSLTQPGHIILCGLGNLGFRIYNQLSVMGVKLIAIDPTPDPLVVVRLTAEQDRVVQGDARLPAVLLDAGIASAGALIATVSDDLVNLQIVLEAIRLRPGLRIVMRFFNVDLAASIQAALPNVTVLSVSSLASPAFVAAATDAYAANAIHVDGQLLSLATLPLGPVGSLEWMNYGHVMAVAWQRPPSPPVLFPSPDITVTTGDWVTLIGPEAEVRAFTRTQARHHHVPLPPPPRRPWYRHVAHVLRSLDRTLYVTLLLLLVLLLFGSDIYSEDRHMPFIDALIAMVGLISTTAVGDSADPNDPIWFKLFIIAVTIAGTIVLAVIYAFVTNYVVSVKLSGLLGQQQVTMRNHVVLCGLGTVGYRVVTGLAAQKEQVALLERSDTNRFLPLVRGLPGTQIVIGDGQLHESLELVNITAARCIVAATSDDIANIQTALNARQLNPRIRVILRMFDQRMAEQVGDIFGFDVALSPSALAAPAFVAAAATGAVVHEFRVDHTELVVARVVVPPARPSSGRTLGSLMSGLPAAVLYYTSPGGRLHYRPLHTRLLTPGDTLLLIAHEATLREVTRRLTSGVKRDP